MHQADHRHQRRAAGQHEAFLWFAGRIDRVGDVLQAKPQRLHPGHRGIVATGLIGSAIEEVELVVGEHISAQANKEVGKESQGIGMGRVQDVVWLAESGVDQQRTIAGLEQPFRVGSRQLRVGGDVEGCQPDADLEPVAVHSRCHGVQAFGEELVGHPVAPTLPARHPAIVELDHRPVAIRRRLDQLWHPLCQERRMAGDIGFRHGQPEVIPAAPAARHGRKAARACGMAGGHQRFAQGVGAVGAVQNKDGIRNQATLRRHGQLEFLGHAAALLRLRERRAMLLGDERADVGGERITFVLVAVVVPAKDGREAARLEHLGDEHGLAVADGRGPPRGRRRFAIAFRDRFIEWVNPGVVPGLEAVDEHAGAPGLITHLQGPAALDHERAPAVECQRRIAGIVELALDDDPALVRDQAGGGERRAGLPVERERVRMRKWCRRAQKPLAVQLDGAGGALNQRAVTGEQGEGAGLLVGERIQVQIAVSLA